MLIGVAWLLMFFVSSFFFFYLSVTFVGDSIKLNLPFFLIYSFNFATSQCRRLFTPN